MKKRSIKIPILGFSILLMGIIGISGGLSVINQHFSNLPQSTIQLLFTFPCIVVIPASLLAGKLQEYISKKMLVVLGILLFLIGGVAPAFFDAFPVIFLLRGLLGFGTGLMQPLGSALVSEYFAGDERSAVMGQQTAAQMLGCAAMVLLGGFLADLGWRLTFYTHLIALIPLVLVLVWLPNEPPARRAAGDATNTATSRRKVRLTPALFAWAGITFLFYIGGQVFSTFIAFLVSAHGLGTAAQSGQTVTLFALGGFLMGLIFGRLSRLTGNQTLAAGFLLCAVSLLGMAFAPNIYVIYLCSLLCGMAFSIIMPSLFLGATRSVDAYSVPMGLSVVMCCQNLGMFLSPTVITPLARAAGGEINRTAMLLAAGLLLLMGVCAVIRGVRRGRRRA